MSMNPKEIVRFGGFELDMRTHELRREGRNIRLQEQPFQILRALLDHSGDVVTREELRHRVWPSSVYVDFDHGLNNAIARLREALGDGTATPRFIETLPRQGYRFICPVERMTHPPVATEPAVEVRLWYRSRTLLFCMALAVAAAVGFFMVRWPALSGWRSDGGTRDAEAQRLYAMGIAELRGRGMDRDPDRAAQLFQDALARDPKFAAAYAGLAIYQFRGAWTGLTSVEKNTRAGQAAADHAIELDPESSEALLARANFEAWRSRSRDDAKAYARSNADFRHAFKNDPSNSAIYFNYARAVMWDDPDLSRDLFARTIELDPLWDMALSFSAMLLSQRGQHDAARSRLRDLSANTLTPSIYALMSGTLDRQLGRLDDAVISLREPVATEGGIQLWSLYLSLGDRVAAQRVLEGLNGGEVFNILREAMQYSMDERVDDAFAFLNRHCDEFPLTHLLDLPTARLALITGHADRARILLLRRLPDLASGVEPIKARNVIPALDLALAYQYTHDASAAKQLLVRVADYLDGNRAPSWPLFVYLRARAHAIADERELALNDLKRAYDDGFRLLWALDLYPQPLLYFDSIDQDPAFANIRSDERFLAWRESIRADNARQLDRLAARNRDR
jgi:DNA-binding winged helix-turn-helix (wHTH) protein/Tfp pilus assembly protein PilF